jgi:hypothetical protein
MPETPAPSFFVGATDLSLDFTLQYYTCCCQSASPFYLWSYVDPLTATEYLSLWVSSEGYYQIGARMSSGAGAGLDVRNTTIAAKAGWTQAVVTLEKHGIGAPVNLKTRLSLRVYSRNS